MGVLLAKLKPFCRSGGGRGRSRLNQHHERNNGYFYGHQNMSMKHTIYGIPNCNSVKKAFTWLDEHNIAYDFHNYKKEGISKEKLAEWCGQLGWENLINKNGTTWRGLDAALQASILDEASAIDLMHSNTSIIKRPVIERDGKVILVRFDEAAYEKAFGS